MVNIEDCKNIIASQKGYNNWEEMENFIINNNHPSTVAILLLGAMELVCYEYHSLLNTSSRKIVKLTSKDAIPTNAKFLYAKEEFQGMYGWVSNLQPHYQTIFYYEVDSD